MKLVFISILLAFSLVGFSQSDSTVYKLSPLKETFLLGAGFSTLGIGYALEKNVSPLTENQISSLRISDVHTFDRSATHQRDLQAKKASDVLVVAAVFSPVALMLSPKIRKEKYSIALMSLEVFCLTSGMTEIIKTNVQRTRPYVYNPNVGLEEKQQVDARFSYLSGHTSVSAGMCFFTAKVFHDYSKNSTAKLIVWSAAALYPALTGFCRYKAGQHFPTDIISGYALGALVGIAIPTLHKKINKNENLSFQPYLLPNQKGVFLTYQF